MIVGILLISGCATKLSEKLTPIDALAQWMKLPERVSFRNSDGDHLVHPFFDLAPFPHTEDMSVNFFPLTPEGANFAYELDLHSGMRYRTFRYCAQNDVWKNVGMIHRPPYTSGIIPRLLDQLGLAQEIKVFGRGDFYRQRPQDEARSFRVRIVGGLIVQYCPKYPCSNKGSWKGRLLYIAVDSEDSRFKDVHSLQELKKKVSWPQVEAMLQNERGRFSATKEDHPAYRLIGEVEAKRSMAYGFKRGHLFQFEEMKSLRENCLKLYDFLWETLSETREGITQRHSGPTEMEKFRERVGQSRFIKEEFASKTEKDKMTTDFASWFKVFQKKYGERFYTCSRFVRPSNINVDIQRHWTFAQLMMFSKMTKLGMTYVCRKRAWIENPRTIENNFLYDINEELRSCRDADLDRAFDAAKRMLSGRAQSRDEYYRYVEYDMREGGSHQKIYSWIFENGKDLGCSDKKQTESVEVTNLFPDDINWNPLSVDTRLDIIR